MLLFKILKHKLWKKYQKINLKILKNLEFLGKNNIDEHFGNFYKTLVDLKSTTTGQKSNYNLLLWETLASRRVKPQVLLTYQCSSRVEAKSDLPSLWQSSSRHRNSPPDLPDPICDSSLPKNAVNSDDSKGFKKL